MQSWVDKRATTAQMLSDVQALKEKAVKAMFKGRVSEACMNAEIDEFMHANRIQILDILDDALYARVNRNSL